MGIPENIDALMAKFDLKPEGRRIIMRRWHRGSSMLMLVADSYADYKDLTFTTEDGTVRVLGVVFWRQVP